MIKYNTFTENKDKNKTEGNKCSRGYYIFNTIIQVKKSTRNYDVVLTFIYSQYHDVHFIDA